MENEMRQDCREQFKDIKDRLHNGDGHFTEHDKDITRLDTNMTYLTSSLKGLTNAIWGACGTALVLLAGFVLWYIQSK